MRYLGRALKVSTKKHPSKCRQSSHLEMMLVLQNYFAPVKKYPSRLSFRFTAKYPLSF